MDRDKLEILSKLFATSGGREGGGREGRERRARSGGKEDKTVE